MFSSGDKNFRLQSLKKTARNKKDNFIYLSHVMVRGQKYRFVGIAVLFGPRGPHGPIVVAIREEAGLGLALYRLVLYQIYQLIYLTRPLVIRLVSGSFNYKRRRVRSSL